MRLSGMCVRTSTLLAVATLTMTACAGPTAAAGADRAVRVRAPAAATIAAAVRVVVVVEDGTGKRETCTGEVTEGATVRSLCESLLSSLKHRGCAGHYEDGDATEPDQLARAMHQVLVVPSGWRIVSAGAQNPDGSASTAIELSVEARG